MTKVAQVKVSNSHLYLSKVVQFRGIIVVVLILLFSNSLAMAKIEPSSLHDRLGEAIQRHDIAQIKAAVHQGAVLDPPGEYSALMTLCGSASNDFDQKVADFLISHGANLNVTQNDRTALDLGCGDMSDITLVPMVKWFLAHGVVIKGDHRVIQSLATRDYGFNMHRYGAEAAELLITHGALIDVVDSEGNTPLLNACIKPFGEEPGALCLAKLAHVLIKHGANVNARNLTGTSPLMGLTRVTGEWRPAALRAALDLMSHGANTDFWDDNGNTALQIARAHRFSKMVALLESRAKNGVPRAQTPLGHVPGITNPDGTPWLPINQ